MMKSSMTQAAHIVIPEALGATNLKDFYLTIKKNIKR